MIDKSFMLPSGDYLRQLIGQTSVKQTDIRSIVRSRGVFFREDDKNTIGPLLIKTGLSPAEYEDLKESYKTKEESPKSHTRSIEWNKESSKTLLDSLQDNYDYVSLLNEPFGVCELNTPPTFSSFDGNPDHIVMNFEISRKDLMRNFGENETFHTGQIEFKKEGADVKVALSLTHTSKETKDFADKVASATIAQFKKSGSISDDAEIAVIKFNDFTNEGRVKFLCDLTQKTKQNILKFIDTRDIHISPDISASANAEDLSWMKDKIEDLKLRGKGLHSTFFVDQESYHKFIKLNSLTCEYEYQGSSYAVNCKITFEFSERVFEAHPGELTLDFDTFKFKYNDVRMTPDKAKKEILKHLEGYKMPLYNQFKIKQ